jgi:hypothetical protein
MAIDGGLRVFEWALAAALGVAAVLVWRALVRRQRRNVIHARLARASEGERRAARLLEAAGYAIRGSQVRARYALVVDGEDETFDVRADYVAERGGRMFVVEVKTGAVAPRLDAPATRRQLLEYGLAFRADGILLVDAEADALHLIEIPWRASSPALARPGFTLAVLVFFGSAALGSILTLVR